MAGDDNKTGNSGDLEKLQETVTKLADSQSQLMTIVGQMSQRNNALESAVTKMSEALSNGINVRPTDDNKPPPKFDDMETSDLVKYMLEEVNKQISSVTEDVNKKFQTLEQSMGRATRSQEIDKVRNAEGNEDFEEWLPEMQELAKRNPNMAVQELLTLARSKDPEKASKLEEKYHPKKDETEDEDKTQSRPFLGLTPTSNNGGVDTSGKEKKPLSTKEAVSAALDEVFPQSKGQENVADGEALF